MSAPAAPLPDRARLLAALIALVALPGAARPAMLGAWDWWAAFRDAPGACRAVSGAIATTRGGRVRDAWVTVAIVPARGIWRQVHVHPSRPAATLRLTIGDRGIALAGAAQAFHAAGPIADASIIATMRPGTVMRIEGRDPAGRAFRDVYRLEGAASAIDAATLACPAG